MSNARTATQRGVLAVCASLALLLLSVMLWGALDPPVRLAWDCRDRGVGLALKKDR